MGGQIFKKQGVEARRINQEEFRFISYELWISLDKDFTDIHVIQSYELKDDFGDIDILVCCDGSSSTPWWKRILENESLKPDITHSARNGLDEISILYKGIQCDFRRIQPEYWGSSVFFCDYDPSSNALGRIARFMGARFGYKGLVWPVYTENKQVRLEDIVISSDPKEICHFFGLNDDRSFLNKEDIFEYIVSNKYYGIEAFKEENWDHATRTRNRKRKLFCEFIEYVNEKHNYNKVKYLPSEEYLAAFNVCFPKSDLKNKVLQSLIEYERKKQTAAKFNGNDVMRLTGLTGIKLGSVLKQYRDSKENYLIFLKIHSKQEIEDDFLKFYNFELLEKLKKKYES